VGGGKNVAGQSCVRVYLNFTQWSVTMRKQLELFDENEILAQTVISYHEPLDALATIDDDIDIAMESCDDNRLIELIQMRTAYSQ
jgi:hypothetical protein